MRAAIIYFILFLATCSPQGDRLQTVHEIHDILPEPIIEFNPEQYVCYKADTALHIDGKMNEPAWQHALWTKDFHDIEGDSKPKPRFRTRAKMLWDATFLYIFAEMEEPDVWAKLKKRDSVIFYDNDFEVFIDPNGDTHRYYELEINAFSTEWDLFLDKPYRDDCRPLFFWDIGGLKSAVHVEGTINQPGDKDKGWSLEIAIPWEVLKECADKEAPPKDGDQWRINFSRVEWQTEVKNGNYEKVINPKTGKPYPEDNWVWSPQGVINMHYPEMWGFVQFSEKIAGFGTNTFLYHPDEDAKWALRQVYYHEQAVFARTGKYTTHIADLQLENKELAGYNWPPDIQCTNNLYEAILTAVDGKDSWHLSQDGKVWQLTKRD